MSDGGNPARICDSLADVPHSSALTAEDLHAAGNLGRSAKRARWRVLIVVAAVAAPVLLIVLAGLLLVLFLLAAWAGIFVLLCFGGGALLFAHGFVDYRSRVTIRNVPTAKASSAAVGLAELCGRVRGTVVTPAPVTGRPCIYWKITVRRDVQKNEENATVFKRVERPSTFELEDDTGRMTVWPAGAQLLPDREVWKSREGSLPEGGAQLLRDLKVNWSDRTGSPRLTVIEERLEDGGSVYVLGTLSERRALPSTSFELDQEKAGFARRAVNRWVESQLAKYPESDAASLLGVSKPPDIDPSAVVVWRGGGRRPFVIARSEQSALKQLSKAVWAQILFGTALMVMALLALLIK